MLVYQRVYDGNIVISSTIVVVNDNDMNYYIYV